MRLEHWVVDSQDLQVEGHMFNGSQDKMGQALLSKLPAQKAALV
tara:strand:+ start:150 stop:281 length:132 start_codon:yes stop_codon:yes gene_type:complete